jgi:hypothetical protein
MDIEKIACMDWGTVNVGLDGSIRDNDGEEFDLSEVESVIEAFAAEVAGHMAKIRKMVAIATGK